MSLLDCQSLEEVDRHVASFLADASLSPVLGDIELSPQELQHLAGLVSRALERLAASLRPSPAVALFLVWSGILHYSEGNYWTPVYRSLGLPQNQIRWQQVLGENFLAVLNYYDLPIFTHGTRYVTPILAHGYVPNVYLDNYLEAAVFPVYRERRKAGLHVEKPEVIHLVRNWREDYYARWELEQALEQCREDEAVLAEALQVVQNQEQFRELARLRALKEESREIAELLALPEGWWEAAQAELEELEKMIAAIRNADTVLETLTRVQMSIRDRRAEIQGEVVRNGDLLFYGKYPEGAWRSMLSALPGRRIARCVTRASKVGVVCSGFLNVTLHCFFPGLHRQARDYMDYRTWSFSALPNGNRRLQGSLPVSRARVRRFQDLLRQWLHLEYTLAEVTERENRIRAKMSKLADLSDLQKSAEQARQKLAANRMNLVVLGKGDKDAGWEILSEQRLIREKIATLEERMGRGRHGYGAWANLQLLDRYSDPEALSRRLNEVRLKMQSLQKELKSVPEPLYYVNESTRAFLLQGEEKAEDFFFASVLCLQEMETGQEWGAQGRLPPRVAVALATWWGEKGYKWLKPGFAPGASAPETSTPSSRRPLIRLDTAERALEVELPSQRLPGREKALFALGDARGSQQWEIPVPVLETRQGEILTESVKKELERPGESYVLVFRCGGHRETWEFPGFSDRNPFWLFSSRGELQHQLELTGTAAFLVAPSGVSIQPKAAERQREPLTGLWSRYVFVCLDLTIADQILARVGNITRAVQHQARLGPGLLGGRAIPGLQTQGGTVYAVSEPPMLTPGLPFPRELRWYGVRIDTPTGSQYQPLSSLEQTDLGEQGSGLSLDPLWPRKPGIYKISLVYGKKVVWGAVFGVVPMVDIKFDRPLYALVVGTRERGTLTISSSQEFTFSPRAPAVQVQSSTFSCVVHFDPREDEVKGTLGFRRTTGQEAAIPVSIPVPGVCWRWKGEDAWRKEVKEVWHEDLDEIEIWLPPGISAGAELSLGGEHRLSMVRSQQGLFACSLQVFSDTLRTLNQPLAEVLLSVPGSEIRSSLLVRIRSRWQVSDLQVEEERQDGQRRVCLRWCDGGMVSNRLVRWWPLQLEQEGYLEREVPEGESRLEIIVAAGGLPAQQYRVQFLVSDPWVADEPELPETGSENCFDVTLGDRKELLQELGRHDLEIVALECEGEKIPLNNAYWVQGIRLEPEFPGEERFQGAVATADPSGATVDLQCNPVSFYFGMDKVYQLPFLVDKDKDGATYCKKCGVLFWEVAHQECEPEVILPEYIWVRSR